MKSCIRRVPEGLVVELEELANDRQRVLELFNACREGRCACPTNEYEKLASLEIFEGADDVRLHMEAVPGERLEASEIETCLAFNGIDVDERC